MPSANQVIEQQLRERGLQLLGPCDHLSDRTELLVESALLQIGRASCRERV